MNVLRFLVGVRLILVYLMVIVSSSLLYALVYTGSTTPSYFLGLLKRGFYLQIEHMEYIPKFSDMFGKAFANDIVHIKHYPSLIRSASH